MGYTHYFPRCSDFNPSQWSRIKDRTKKIFAEMDRRGVKIAFEDDNPTPPVVDEEMICFEGYETFVIYRRNPDPERFCFCKTAGKPYDLAVMLVLLACHDVAPHVLSISSDGDWDNEWLGGRKVYKELFNVEPSCPWRSVS